MTPNKSLEHNGGSSCRSFAGCDLLRHFYSPPWFSSALAGLATSMILRLYRGSFSSESTLPRAICVEFPFLSLASWRIPAIALRDRSFLRQSDSRTCPARWHLRARTVGCGRAALSQARFHRPAARREFWL